MPKQHFLKYAFSFTVFVFWLLTFFFISELWLYAKSPAVQQTQNSCLWSVQTQSNKVYLLGSFHFFKQDAYPLAASIKRAYADSQILVFETDIDAMKNPVVQDRILKLGMYPEGQDLLQNLDGSTRQLLEKKLTELGLPIEAFSPYKPWFVAMQIEIGQLLGLGFSPKYGIDAHFFDKAKTDRKEVRFLESTEFQINLLGKMVEKDQNAFLKQTLKELESVDELAKGLVKFWKAGDSERLHDLLSKSFKGYPDLHNRLLLQRNKNWIEKIETFMRENKNVLFVVGAGHLVGPESVVDLLRSKGYKVKQK